MPKTSDALGEMMVVDALNRIDGKLDKLDDRLDEQGKTLVKQAASLDEHIKRSDLLEKKIELETATIKAELPKAVQEEFRSIRNKYLLNAAKVIGGLAGLGGGGMGVHHGVKALWKIWNP